MKRIVALIILAAMVLSIALLAGCSSNGGDVKTGLGHIISIAKSKDATADKDGLAEADVVMASVSIDGKGKILSVTIDMAQTKIGFNNAGAITADKAAEQKTKVELGDAYGLRKSSGIGKEWYEEIADLEKWMIGKTIEEVMGMKTKEVDGKVLTDEADLTSKVTVGIADYLKAVEEAVKNAK